MKLPPVDALYPLSLIIIHLKLPKVNLSKLSKLFKLQTHVQQGHGTILTAMNNPHQVTTPEKPFHTPSPRRASPTPSPRPISHTPSPSPSVRSGSGKGSQGPVTPSKRKGLHDPIK